MKKEIIPNNYEKILGNIIGHIEQSKLRAFSEINKALLNSYLNIGQELSQTSSYGTSVVEKLSNDLKLKYPGSKGYSTRNLWNMKRFYENYRKMQPAVAELIFEAAWTNHLVLMDMTKSDEEKEFYLKMSIKEKWSKRELIRQIDSSLYERYMLADKPEKVTALIPQQKKDELAKHFKDEYILEFLDLGKNYSEKELQNSILENLKSFFLEFGKDFTFVGQEYPIRLGNKEYRVDLLFFHRSLKCLVAVELKVTEFKPEYIGKMQFYLNLLDGKVRNTNENPSIGLILCKSKEHDEVKFALAKTVSPIKVATYTKKLPDKKLILKRLENIKIPESTKDIGSDLT